MSSSTSSSHEQRVDNLHKNAPSDLSSIIKKVIEDKVQQTKLKSVSVRRKCLSLSWNLDQPPPETPLPENAPQSLIWNTELNTFIPENENRSRNKFETNISHDGSPDLWNCTGKSRFSELVDQLSNNDSDIHSEFNSCKYWYINPDLALDYDVIKQSNVKNDERDREMLMYFAQIVEEPNDELLTTDDDKKENASKNLSNLMKRLSDYQPQNFKQDVVPADLIKYFASMIHNEDTDVNFFCAYNFPAVVLTLGRENWSIMFDLLQVLCGEIQWKIRKTVAASIYQIALIVGKEIASRDLAPIFLGFFKDLDEIKIEALRNLTNFLKVIKPNGHDSIVMILGNCLQSDSASNWRLREELAQQLCLLMQMYEGSNKKKCILYITGLSIMLLTDSVYNVRKTALNAIIVRLKNGTDINIINLLILKFAKNENWKRRQIFAIICEKLISEKVVHPIVYQNMIQQLILLSSDTVPNIRLYVAKCFAHEIIVFSKAIYSAILDAIYKLQNDKDRDVSDILDNYTPTVLLKISEENVDANDNDGDGKIEDDNNYDDDNSDKDDDVVEVIDKRRISDDSDDDDDSSDDDDGVDEVIDIQRISEDKNFDNSDNLKLKENTDEAIISIIKKGKIRKKGNQFWWRKTTANKEKETDLK